MDCKDLVFENGGADLGFSDRSRGLYSGGNWNNSSNNGRWASNWNNAPTNTNTNIGFRCALPAGE